MSALGMTALSTAGRTSCFLAGIRGVLRAVRGYRDFPSSLRPPNLALWLPWEPTV